MLNVSVKTLPQGDNQVVCTQFKLPPTRTDNELVETLNNLVFNNEIIVGAMTQGTIKPGLTINQDETLQSADLVYGKVPIFRGNPLRLDNKRISNILRHK